jgi:hypothetical protein
MRLPILALFLLTSFAAAAPPNRITSPVDGRRVRVLRGGVHRLAQPAFDRGAVAPESRLDDIVLMTKLSRAQQRQRRLTIGARVGNPPYQSVVYLEEWFAIRRVLRFASGCTSFSIS